MLAATCVLLLLASAADGVSDAPTIVKGRQGNRPVSFGGGLTTSFEGQIVALLGSCTSGNVAE